jgi:Short C-terminal domain
VLFLYRPRQTWMPYRLPRNLTEQGAYNRQAQRKFDATRRVAPRDPAAAVSPPSRDTIAELKDLAQLHASGALDDEEFSAAKAKLLGSDLDSS